MGSIVGFAIELLVAVLLVATIVHCASLDRKLKRLKTDEAAMRDMVADLIGATERAERAVAALKTAVSQSEETLAERLGRAEALSREMAGQLGEGEEVIGRITKIAKAAREHATRVAEAAPAPASVAPAAVAPAPAPAPMSASAAAAAAERFADRIRALSLGHAT